ncbi:MAG: diaminopimelate epimerase [Alphaproteobacteria bacterium]|nr:diaminopimelate epimerase [Alphaproteobacteria bacterium]
MSELDFHKMHGLGNDFVIVDQRSGKLSLSAEQIQQIGDRRQGVGFDQLLLLEPSSQADVFMRVYNPDGSESGACGNGTRCVARLMMEEHGLTHVAVETAAGVLEVKPALRGYSVKMGRPRISWDEIPLSGPMDTLHLDIEAGPLSRPTAVGMGNPHAVFFVDDAEAIDLEARGPELEHHAFFPERANIGVAEVRDPENIRLRVFERGAGITSACGSGACAALVAAARRDLTGPAASVWLDGGRLHITWGEDGQVTMTGPATHSFKGRFEPDMLAQCVGKKP